VEENIEEGNENPLMQQRREGGKIRFTKKGAMAMRGDRKMEVKEKRLLPSFFIFLICSDETA